MNRAVLDRAVLGLPNIGVADVGNVGVMGAYDDTEVKPYIKGHITDGSSTFTFKVNNADVTVPVDANGNWKWVVDRTITSLQDLFYQATTLDRVKFAVDLSDCKSLFRSFYGCSNLVTIVGLEKQQFAAVTNFGAVFTDCTKLQSLDLRSATFENATVTSSVFASCESLETINLNTATFAKTTSLNYMFQYCKKLKVISFPQATFEKVTNARFAFGMCTELQSVLIPNAEIGALETNAQNNLMFGQSYNVENITLKSLANDQSFVGQSKLTEQSIVNLFNAVAADGITLTFNGTMYVMIQAQLAITDSPIYTAYYNKIQQYNFTIARA